MAEGTAHGGSFDRKQCLLDLLPDGQSGYRTVKVLCDLLECEGFDANRRNIERDLIALERSGRYAIKRSKGKPAGWSWQAGRKPPPHRGMDEETALAYVLLERFLTPLLPKPLFGQLVAVFAEARRRLAAMPGRKLGAWSQRIVVDTAGQPLLLPEVEPRVQQVVSDALLQGRQCEFYYRSPNHPEGKPPKRCRVAPLGLVLRDGVQYLMCCLDGGKQVYSYALHRMSSPAPLDVRAHVPADFNLTDHVVRQRAIDISHGGTFKLELRVSEWWARFLAERRLAKDQVISDIAGSKGKRVVATVADTEQLRWWLLSLGADVEVLKPTRLRKQMAEKTAAMARRYRRSRR